MAVLYSFFIVLASNLSKSLSTIFTSSARTYPAGNILIVLSLMLFPAMALMIMVEILKSLPRLGLTFTGTMILALFGVLVSLIYLAACIETIEQIAVFPVEFVTEYTGFLMGLYAWVLLFCSVAIVSQREFWHAKRTHDVCDPWYDSGKVTKEKDCVLDAPVKSTGEDVDSVHRP